MPAILPKENADHATRLLEMQARAVSVFEEPVVAMQWMLTESPLLSGMRPIDAAATQTGYERALTILLRAEGGVGV